MLGNWQIAIESSITVLLVNRKVWSNTIRADKQFLKAFSPTKFLQCSRVTVIEVFMTDKDIIITRLNPL